MTLKHVQSGGILEAGADREQVAPTERIVEEVGVASRRRLTHQLVIRIHEVVDLYLGKKVIRKVVAEAYIEKIVRRKLLDISGFEITSCEIVGINVPAPVALPLQKSSETVQPVGEIGLKPVLFSMAAQAFYEL